MNNDHLRTYFLSFGRALNASGLEEQLGLSFRVLRYWIAGQRDLPEHHLPKVLAWAKYYGYDPSRQYDQIV